jgi:ketosteroid isomerase-like protein
MGAPENVGRCAARIQGFQHGRHEDAHGALRRERLVAHPGAWVPRWRPRGPRGDLCVLRPAGAGDGGTFRAELRHLTADDDDRVIAIHHNSGERGGKHLDVECCLVFELKDGRVTDGSEHFEDIYAWDAFWS